MMSETVAVLATGMSMSRDLANSLTHLPRIVINDAFRLAPDAIALVANDKSWWKANQEAFKFKGRKFSIIPWPPFVERASGGGMTTVTNSGLLGLHVALTVFKFKRVLLYGFDMRGSHYFGPHKGLPNTKPERYEIFKRQFDHYTRTYIADGVEVINATPGSALKCFPFLWNMATSDISC